MVEGLIRHIFVHTISHMYYINTESDIIYIYDLIEYQERNNNLAVQCNPPTPRK